MKKNSMKKLSPQQVLDKIIMRETMKQIMEEHTELRFVSTNGCFDVVHRGHLEFLLNARSLGDRLLVGLNSDDSIRNRKGPDRPVVKEPDRAFLLASLFFVDYVIIFTEDKVNDLLIYLTPQLHVKGGDYKQIQDLDEYEAVQSYGGELRLLSQIGDYSTTQIIQQIQHP